MLSFGLSIKSCTVMFIGRVLYGFGFVATVFNVCSYYIMKSISTL